jgi:hypothetical protein
VYVHGGGVRRIGDRSRGTDGGSGEGGSAARKAQIAPDCRCRRLRLPPLSGRTRTHQQHGVGFGGSVPLNDSGLKGNVHSDERSMSVVGHLKERQMKKGKADQVSNRSGEGRRMEQSWPGVRQPLWERRAWKRWATEDPGQWWKKGRLWSIRGADKTGEE